MNPVDELNLLLGIGPSRPQLPLTLRKSGYLPVRALGKGSYGQAFLVFHEPQQTYFVVKHLNLAGMSSRQQHDAHNEISILQKLNHPNIIRYVEYYEEHPHLYIVMEYADGGDVYSLLSSAQTARKMAAAGAYRGRGVTSAVAGAASGSAGPTVAPSLMASSGMLTEAQVVSLFVQTTMAVKYMHDRRLLHRDIKSSNIFLTKNHVVKLGDFGISTVLQSTVAMASTMCGTPCYFSPELCQGRPYNSKSDMWALGILLYELCAGHVPFESTTMKALMRDIVHKQPRRIPPVYSEPLWELIVQLLQKDARRRPDAGQVLLSPVLMQHVPDLIQQLAADSARSKPPQPGAVARANSVCEEGLSRNLAADQGAPPPPQPPPRRAQAPGPAPGNAGNAPVKKAPSKSDVAPKGSAGRSDDGTTPISELLARFDREKQRLVDNKQRKSGVQGDDVPSTRGSRDDRGAGSRPAIPDGGAEDAPRYSPGAAAALRQQGVRVVSHLPGGASEAGPAAVGVAAVVAEAGAGAKHPRAFAPPPLPAALREAAAAGAHGGGDPQRSPAQATPSPLQARQRNNSDGGGEAHQPRSPAKVAAAAVSPPAAKNGASKGRQPTSAAVAAPAGELGAVLSELSSWRERSALRQRRQGNQRTHHEDASQPVNDPPPKRRSSASRVDSGACASPSSASALPSSAQPVSTASHRKVGKAAEPTASRAAPIAAKAPPSSAVAQPPPPSTTAAAPPNHEPTTAGLPKAASATPKKRAGTSSDQTAAAPSPQDGNGAEEALSRCSDGSSADDEPSKAHSFEDVLGTALDVDAIQAASVAAQREQLLTSVRSASPALVLPSSSAALSARLHDTPSPADGSAIPPATSTPPPPLQSQQFMKMTFQGTSDMIDALQPALPAGSVFRHTPTTAMQSEVMRGTGSTTTFFTSAAAAAGPGEGKDEGNDDAQSAADICFSTSCLCGEATTRHGSLCLIYGSFVCACTVCARLTGAVHGVEWVHLPEVADLQTTLSPSTPPLQPSSSRPERSVDANAAASRPSAGAGASAAAALRAQSGTSSPSNERKGKDVAQAGGGGIRGQPAPQASSSATAGAAINGEVHRANAVRALAAVGVRAYAYNPLCASTTPPPARSESPIAKTGYVIYTCLTCGGLMGMVHDGVDGLLLPKISLDAQSLDVLAMCAQAADLESAELVDM